MVLKIVSYPSESWVLPILVMSCFVLYAGIAAAFFFESWFQIHLFAPWMLMPIISLFSGNTPSFAILYFSKKNDVRVVWQWLCTAGRTLKMFAKNYTKTFHYCPESMKPYSETSTALRKIIQSTSWAVYCAMLPRLFAPFDIGDAISITALQNGHPIHPTQCCLRAFSDFQNVTVTVMRFNICLLKSYMILLTNLDLDQ